MAEYKMTWDERMERAKDLIAFLSAFDIPLDDAQNICSIAYAKIKGTGVSEYKKAGASMSVFAGLYDDQQKGLNS